MHGVLLRFGSPNKHVQYFGLATNREKVSSHHVIEEAYYNNVRHPAGAQVLMDMGYNIPSAPVDIVIVTP